MILVGEMKFFYFRELRFNSRFGADHDGSAAIDFGALSLRIVWFAANYDDLARVIFG